eukprot:486686_1
MQTILPSDLCLETLTIDIQTEYSKGRQSDGLSHLTTALNEIVYYSNVRSLNIFSWRDVLYNMRINVFNDFHVSFPQTAVFDLNSVIEQENIENIVFRDNESLYQGCSCDVLQPTDLNAWKPLFWLRDLFIHCTMINSDIKNWLKITMKSFEFHVRVNIKPSWHGFESFEEYINTYQTKKDSIWIFYIPRLLDCIERNCYDFDIKCKILIEFNENYCGSAIESNNACQYINLWKKFIGKRYTTCQVCDSKQTKLTYYWNKSP